MVNIAINGSGEVIDYAIKMREFPQSFILNKLIEKNKIDEKIIDNIVDILVNFYRYSKSTNDINYYGTTEVIRNNTEENFEQTKGFINLTIIKEMFYSIKKRTDYFINANTNIFDCS